MQHRYTYRLALIIFSVLIAGCSDNGSVSDNQAATSDSTDMNASDTDAEGFSSAEHSRESGCQYVPAAGSEQHTQILTSPNSSESVPTSDLAIRFSITADQFHQTEPVFDLSVRIHSWTDYQNNTNVRPFPDSLPIAGSPPLELTGNDKVVVIAKGVRYVLEDKPIYASSGNVSVLLEGFGNYNITLENLAPGDCIRIAIERDNDRVQALDTIIRVPPIFTMASPKEGDSFWPDENIVINWGLYNENGNVENNVDLSNFRSTLLCRDDEGEFDKIETEYDPIDVGSTPRAPLQIRVSNLLTQDTKHADDFGNPKSVSGCKIELRVASTNEPEFQFSFDPVLANSTTELSGYFDSSVVSLFLRRTILLR